MPSEHAKLLIDVVTGIQTIPRVLEDPVESNLYPAEQTDILVGAATTYLPIGENLSDYLMTPFMGPGLNGLTRFELLREYTVACLARQKNEKEMKLVNLGQEQFAIQDTGDEVTGIAELRGLDNQDPVATYYRNTSEYVYRGGLLKDIFALNLQRQSDQMTGGTSLASLISDPRLGFLASIADVPFNVLPGAGVARGLMMAEEANDEVGWRRFGKHAPVTTIDVCEGSMVQGKLAEALQAMMFNPKTRMRLVIHDNGSAISTPKEEGNVNGDPLVVVRGFEKYGLKIIDADASNIAQLFDACRDSIESARQGPTVLYIKNIPKLKGHSASDDDRRYKTPSEIEKKLASDPLIKYRQFLIDQGVATAEELDFIMDEAFKTAERVANEVLEDDSPDADIMHRIVYAPELSFKKSVLVDMGGLTIPIDTVASTRAKGITYINGSNYQTDTPQINMLTSMQLALAEQLKRDPLAMYWGEDVGDLGRPTIRNLEGYVLERFEDMRKNSANKYNEFQPHIEDIMEAVSLIKAGRGYEVDPLIMSMYLDIAGGKGGVFGLTLGLQHLAGGQRVFNSPLAEQMIAGMSEGLGLRRHVLAEFQFDSYFLNALAEVVESIATHRKRTNGKEGVPLVMMVNGMNRLGGIGDNGHGNVVISKFDVPGILHVAPAHANEAGPLLREAMRVAFTYGQPVIYYVPISELRASIGHYQTAEKHIPLGEAEVVDFSPTTSEMKAKIGVVTFSNNWRLVQDAAVRLGEEGIGVIGVNTRTMGVQTDWEALRKVTEQTGKIMLFDSERDSSALQRIGQIMSQGFFHLLDSPIIRIGPDFVQTPAGKKNEERVLPQVDGLVYWGRKLAKD